jgi:hypothetical protein
LQALLQADMEVMMEVKAEETAPNLMREHISRGKFFSSVFQHPTSESHLTLCLKLCSITNAPLAFDNNLSVNVNFI